MVLSSEMRWHKRFLNMKMRKAKSYLKIEQALVSVFARFVNTKRIHLTINGTPQVWMAALSIQTSN